VCACCVCASSISVSNVVCVKVVDCRGNALLPYMAMLQQVMDRTLHLACREGYLSSSCILRHILSSLTSITPLEYCSVPGSFDRPIKDYLPIKVCIFTPFTYNCAHFRHVYKFVVLAGLGQAGKSLQHATEVVCAG
jgi:hypothetical protein